MIQDKMDLDLKDVVGSAAVLTTILQFLSGILVCKKYVANGSTGEASPLPFICAVLSCGVWLLYGLTKPDHNIVLVNIVGIVLMTSYVLVFYIYTIKKTVVLKQTAFMGTILFTIVLYSITSEDYSIVVNRLGSLACSLGLVTVAAPLGNLVQVIRMKSAESLPFPMILMSFFVTSLWFFYGVIVEDAYLSLPNFIAAALAVFQLTLFVIYPSRRQPTASSKTVLA